MRLVLVSILLAIGLSVAGCGGDEGDEGTLYCCAVDTLCDLGSGLYNPCLMDKAVLDAANSGKESNCKKMLDSEDLDVHLYDCSQRADCYYTEQDALAACR